MTNSLGRHFCFTLNNPLSTELNWNNLEKVRYAIWQLEKGETRQTLHLQGYVELDSPARTTYFRNVLPNAHLEIRRGSRDQARDYCRKEDSREQGPWEYGNWEVGGQGKRSDIDRFKDLLASGATEKEIAETEFGCWLKYPHAIERWNRLHSPTKRDKPMLTNVNGPPGSSKSTICRRLATSSLEDNEEIYFKNDTRWWCGLTPKHTKIIMDDFYGSIPLETLAKIVDVNPVLLEVKGAQVPLTANEIYITSNRKPEEWYVHQLDMINAFQRRVDREITLQILPSNQLRLALINYDTQSPGHPVRERGIYHFDISENWDELNQWIDELIQCDLRIRKSELREAAAPLIPCCFLNQ
mgnify:CR=1 FL=1